MLVELGLVEQRYQAVLEVLNDGATVTDVARRYGVAAPDGARVVAPLRGRGAGRVGRSQLAGRCRARIRWPPELEARIVEMRRAHPGWGPRTILFWLDRDGVSPLPGRTSVERCLIRHGLVDPAGPEAASGRTTSGGSGPGRWSCGRWTSSAGSASSTGSEAKIVSGIDDHSRFVVSARVVARATARPVCDALALAMRRHGVPEQILTDNGKVFTARFGPGPGPVLFDRICTDNGIKHLLTAPRSPTTTGKVERWHKTLRREFLDGKVFASIDDAQAQLDAWVRHYNHERPHQSIGRVPPIERFQLAAPRPAAGAAVDAEAPRRAGPVTTRRVSAKGTIGFATARYKAGAWLAGQTVEVVCEGGLVQIHHRGVLIATHARRHPLDKQTAGLRARPQADGRHDPSADRGVGDPQGRLVRQRVLRRRQLPGRLRLPASPGASRRRRRHRRDLHRRAAHPHPPGQARPHPRARRPRQPRRPPPPHQRRLRVRPVRQVPGPKCQAGTGA